MTLQQAKELKSGEIVHFDHNFTARGKCRNFRVNGKVKTWKRNVGRVYVPLKSGLYVYGAVTEWNLDRLHTEGECTNA
jgi:hypothetical protein